MSSLPSSATDTNAPEFVTDDVSRLTAINKTLQTSESRYRRLFETAKDGILLLNSKTAQIEDVNPFLMDLLGYSYDEFLGKKIGRLEPSKTLC